MKSLQSKAWRLAVLMVAACGVNLGSPGGAVMAAAQGGLAASGAEARVIVRFKADAPSVRAKILAAGSRRSEALSIAQTRATGLSMRSGHALNARFSLDERTHVVTARGIDAAALARRLAQDAEVEMVAVDHRRRALASPPNDPLYAGNNGIAPNGKGQGSANGQWYLKAPGGAVVSSINAPAAWEITHGAAAVPVAVIDTGVRFDHPDLAGQILPGYDMIGAASVGSNGVANDNTPGADSDASDPGDWVTQAEDNDPNGEFYHCSTPDEFGHYYGSDSSWHGTKVSGLIAAATNNGAGIAGLAYGSKVLPLRVLGKCGGYDSDIMAGMKWAAGIAVPGVAASNPTPARVLNMSLGGTGSCALTDATGKLYREVIDAVTAKGTVIVAAAGNSEGQAVGLPGNCPGVIAVTGLRHVGSKVGFSSVGPEVAIAAPGGNCVNLSGPCLYPMLSSTNSGTQAPVPNDAAYTDNEASVGTSFSAPLVSGTVALMLSARPVLTPAEVLILLKKTARPFATSGGTAGIAQCQAPSTAVQDECYCTTSTCGAGMLDAGAAVAAAQAANGAVLKVDVTPASPQAGQTVTLNAAASSLGAGRSIAKVAWTLVDGGGAVTGFSGATDALTATLSPSAAGTIAVKLVLTDDQGLNYSQTSSITVAAAPAVTPPPVSSGGGGGGGAMSAAWLAGLLLLSLALRRPSARRASARRG